MVNEHLLDRVREYCLRLPDAHETLTWGEPHFRVNNKIFAGVGLENDTTVLGLKLNQQHAAEVVQIPGFWKAKYVGHKGWVSIDLEQIDDWRMIDEMLLESYQLIAPKRSLRKLDHPDNAPEPLDKPTSDPTSARTAKKKTVAKKKKARKSSKKAKKNPVAKKPTRGSR